MLRRAVLKGLVTVPFGNQRTGFNNPLGALSAFQMRPVPNGWLFYQGAPTHNNLVASVTSAGGTDRFGNLYLGGEFVYGNVAGTYWAIGTLATGLGTAGYFIYTAASQAGPWAQKGEVGFQFGSGEMLLNAASLVFSTLAGSTVAGGLTADKETVTGILTATGGTAAGPTLITTDTMQPLGALGAAGITVAEATFYMLPTGAGGKNQFFISVKGATSGAGPTAGSSTFANALPPAYIPATSTPLPVQASTPNTAWWLNVGTGGLVILHYPTVGAGVNFSCQASYDLQ